MQPTIGRIVHYTLNAGDAQIIESRRAQSDRVGNHVEAGQVYPALVVRVFDPSAPTVNLQVYLDGDDSYWATSRTEGDTPGSWSWPPRV
ncbi:hypothetical protein [Acrocarpospora catenulata]|uniref:hypothetical protein n=1 Tax=Acrocarpospora catenulata TaxID=2836182 RepID=UPI001BDA37E1|nr:hypothetical protein [Acrocarpospora catenulata]